jgi:nucleotide-binding universal stress UspA family protein
MKRFKNILFIHDPASPDEGALRRASSLAKRNQARLTLFSVLSDVPPSAHLVVADRSLSQLQAALSEERSEILDQQASDIAADGVEVATRVVTGTAFLEIIRQVLREQNDLVILTAEGKGGIKERMFGSTSMHLMRKCPCPVWVIKPKRAKPYKRIMAAVDVADRFADEPERRSLNSTIMQIATDLARMENSELHLVQAWSLYAEGYLEARGGMSDKQIRKMRQELKRQYEARISTLLDNADLRGVEFHQHLVRSSASEAIIKQVKKHQIDLLVMGTVCRTGLSGFFIGNTAEKVLGNVDCSVLTLKPEGFVSPVTLRQA